MSADAPLTGDTVDAPFEDSATETLVAAVEEYDGESDECTIYPLRAEDGERVTTWISAKDDSFVAMDEMR